MHKTEDSYSAKLVRSLPWLSHYPFWRAREIISRLTDNSNPKHLLFLVANHFEPSWRKEGGFLPLNKQMARLEEWCRMARSTGLSVHDSDGKPFRHTNFFPAEQYHRPLLELMAELQADGFGEVEIHLHHGVEAPDTANNLKRELETFRDILAEEHRCLSRRRGGGLPNYGFVHGNLALANSAGGRFCGVDSELKILAETGCYADFTLPSAPNETQVSKLNAVYECGNPLDERRAHRSGPNLRVGSRPKLPVIFTGPLVFDWSRRIHGFPVPRLDDGVLSSNYQTDLSRLARWAGARVGVRDRPEWAFIKLYCHGFFEFDKDATIGSSISRFWTQVLELAEQTGAFKIHFVTAREAFNIVMAAVEGKQGNPHEYRDYQLQLIMNEGAPGA